MPSSKRARSRPETRRDRVAHIRYSEAEFLAVAAAAEDAGMSVSAFVRSLSLEGAGVQPFLSPSDQAILELLGRDMHVVGNALNQLARALNAGRQVDRAHLSGAIDDARAVAVTVAAEFGAMTRAIGVARRGEAA